MTTFDATEVESWAECTHLVTDKVRRTIKFLCAIAAGKHIVSMKWIDECKKAKQILPAEDYILEDHQAQDQYGFKLRESLEKARKTSLFSGYRFYITASCRPSKADMKDVLTASGGQV